MTLYEFVKATQRDFDACDDVFDTSVTVCYIPDDEAENDDYDRFCIGIIKKVEMIRQVDDCVLCCKWTDMIKRNMDKFRAFTREHWMEDCQYEDDEDEFIYQWIKEIHLYMAGYVDEKFYTTLVDFLSTLE